MKAKCPNPECKYEWETNSKLDFVTCPNCQKKFRKDQEVKKTS